MKQVYPYSALFIDITYAMLMNVMAELVKPSERAKILQEVTIFS
jgi:hypothetical protein